MLRSNKKILQINMKIKNRKHKKMSLLTKLAYEFLPTTDVVLLNIDKQIAQL